MSESIILIVNNPVDTPDWWPDPVYCRNVINDNHDPSIYVCDYDNGGAVVKCVQGWFYSPLPTVPFFGARLGFGRNDRGKG